MLTVAGIFVGVAIFMIIGMRIALRLTGPKTFKSEIEWAEFESK